MLTLLIRTLPLNTWQEPLGTAHAEGLTALVHRGDCDISSSALASRS